MHVNARQSRKQRVGGKAQGYRWIETESTLDLFVTVPEGTEAKKVRNLPPINLR